MPNFWHLPFTPIFKLNNILWVCWFFGKNLSNFVYPFLKLDNPYCHNKQARPFTNRLHRGLGYCRFHCCGFQLCAFSKNSQNIQLIQFSLHKRRNSFTHELLVTLYTSECKVWMQWHCNFHIQSLPSWSDFKIIWN